MDRREGDHKKHLLSDNGCDFALVECPNRCPDGIRGHTKRLRKNVFYHLKHHCELRKVRQSKLISDLYLSSNIN